MIDATAFADVETSVGAIIKAGLPEVFVSNTTPSPTIPPKAVIVEVSGGGFRDWGEAAANAGINVYADSDDGVDGCRKLTQLVQNILAVASNDFIQEVRVPAGGGTSVPRQSPPYQRYFVATVYLRGQSVL